MFKGVRPSARRPTISARKGQDWGISALSPVGLESQDYAPFADLIADVTPPGRCAQDRSRDGPSWQLFLGARSAARPPKLKCAHVR